MKPVAQSFRLGRIKYNIASPRNKNKNINLSVAVIPKLGYLVRQRLALGEKPLDWVGSSKRDFLAFPSPVQREIGNALGLAQFAARQPNHA
jgi:hypothetical protein